MPTAEELDAAPVPVLYEYLLHDDPRLRGDSACALGDRLRTKELLELDPEVQERMATLLQDPVPIVQLEAAIALAEAQDHRATPVLLQAMRHRHFRLDAIRALGTAGDPQAIEPLLGIMSRRLMAWADRLQAAAALCALGNAEGAAYLRSKLTSRKRPERAAAIHFIGESRHPEALPLLREILTDPTHPMLDVAVRAAGFLPGHQARPLLESMQQRATGELLEDITEALQRINRSAR